MKKVLVASLLAHAAVFALVARTRTAAPPPASAPVAFDEVTIEPESLPGLAAEPEPRAAVEPSVAAVTAVRRAAAGGAPATAAPTVPASSAGLEPIAGGNADWVVNLGPGVETGRFVPGGANPFLTRPPVASGAPGPSPEGPPKKDDALASGLKAAFLAPDTVNGLAAPVARALEDETRTSLAPVQGNAVFRAIVDATGAVTGLKVLESTGDRAGWNDARDRALAALQRKKLDLRGSNGAMIDIRVESELRYPSGATNRVGVSGPLSLSGDVSDFGVKPSRVVKARVSSYTPL